MKKEVLSSLDGTYAPMEVKNKPNHAPICPSVGVFNSKKEAKEYELDRLVQQWACRQRSMMSLRRSEVGHHIIRRNVYLLRWDINNIMPLTNEEHRYAHSHKNEVWESLDSSLRVYLKRKELMDLKDYLLKNGKTYNEFLDEKLDFWKGKIDEKL